MEVKVFHLTTGEDVLAELVKYSPHNNRYTLKNAAVIMPSPGQGQGLSFSFLPWPMFAQHNGTFKGHEVDVEGETVVTSYEPSSNLVAKFQEMTTGLAIPPKSSLILG